jgi:nucleoside-diphosphate-sugar epimerase
MAGTVHNGYSGTTDFLIGMKKVLVTGATGFIGNYVVIELLKRGFEVVATSFSEEKAKMKAWYASVHYIPFDLRSFSASTDYYRFFQKPDLLIHLAWEGLPNYKSDFHITENLPAHKRFISNLVENGLTDITVTGTCFEYGMKEGVLSEDMPPDPVNAYAIAKDKLRTALLELNKKYSFSLKWVRLFYLYGEGQNSNSLLSQLRQAVDNGDPVFNMSPGDQLRDYLPVETAARYIADIAQGKVKGIVNCCSGIPIQVKELVTAYLAGHHAHIELNLGYYPYPDTEPRNFWGDTKKLKTILIHE